MVGYGVPQGTQENFSISGAHLKVPSVLTFKFSYAPVGAS